jgi:hypothetical protein
VKTGNGNGEIWHGMAWRRRKSAGISSGRKMKKTAAEGKMKSGEITAYISALGSGAHLARRARHRDASWRGISGAWRHSGNGAWRKQ